MIAKARTRILITDEHYRICMATGSLGLSSAWSGMTRHRCCIKLGIKRVSRKPQIVPKAPCSLPRRGGRAVECGGLESRPVGCGGMQDAAFPP